MFLAAHPLIVARLLEKCPDFRDVSGAKGLVDVHSMVQVTPACRVLWTPAARPKANADQGRSGLFVERYTCYVPLDLNEDVEAELGKHFTAIHAALGGWRPTTRHRPLEISEPPPVDYRVPGYIIAGLTYKIEFAVQTAN